MKDKKVAKASPVKTEKEANKLITNDQSEKLAYIICTYKNDPHAVLKVQEDKKDVYLHGKQAVIQILKDAKIYAHLVTDDWCLIEERPENVERVRNILSEFCKITVSIRKNNNINLTPSQKKKTPTNNTIAKKINARNVRKEHNRINAAKRVHQKMGRIQKKIFKKVESVKSSEDKVVLSHRRGSNLSSLQKAKLNAMRKKTKSKDRKEMFKVNQKMWFDLKHPTNDVTKTLNNKHEIKKNNGKPIQQKLKFANQKSQVKQAA